MVETTGVAAGTGGILATAQAVVLSPIFGVALLGGIIAYEWWKGSKDSQEIKAAKKAV